MSNVGQLLKLGLILDVIDHSDQIKPLVVINIEVVELFSISMRVQVAVFQRILVTAQVAQPDIVASLSCKESRRLVCLVDDPRVGRVKQAMLEEHWGFASCQFTFNTLAELAWYTVKS